MKYNKYMFIDILAFLSTLLIGADRLGIHAGGVQLKLVQVFLLFLGIRLLFKNNWKIIVPSVAVAFAFFSLCSVLFSKYINRAILYYSNIFFNVFINFTAFTLYLKLRGIDTFIKIYRITMYIQFFLMVIQMILGYSGWGGGVWSSRLRFMAWICQNSFMVLRTLIFSNVFDILGYGIVKYVDYIRRYFL